MKLSPTPLSGAYFVDIEPIEDSRGFFARTVCSTEFAKQGLCGNFIQQSVSWNKSKGIIRGLHFQSGPNAEEKLVRVTSGRIFDVIVDMRKESRTFAQWYGVELSASNRRALYIPKGFAHGFQTLQDDTELLYEMTVHYVPGAAAGVRWDDPAIGIKWPAPQTAILSEKDKLLPTLNELNL